MGLSTDINIIISWRERRRERWGAGDDKGKQSHNNLKDRSLQKVKTEGGERVRSKERGSVTERESEC